MGDMVTEDIVKRFAVADYVVFFLSLAISAAIGIYFGCTGKKQSTTQEFLLADRSMSVIPVTLSMFASFVSAVTILGFPAESYTSGFMIIWITLSFVPGIFIASTVYLPVFYRLGITSIYQYLEMRFNRPTRILAACCFILQNIMYMAVAVYGPSLAISAVTGLNTWLSVIAVSVVCIFYTALGGMKAVLWTDTLQAAIMFMGVSAVLIQGFIICGWDQVWEDAFESGRLDINYSPNPLERHSIWSIVVGGSFYWLAAYATTQVQFQRALTLPTLLKVKLSLWLNIPLMTTIAAMSCIVGLVIYSYYKLCDPIGSGSVTAADQLYPLFVMETLGHLSGLPGLILAAVASGSLSTVSSSLNSLSAVLLVDIVTPLKKQPFSDKHAAIFTRLIAVILGLIVILFTFFISNFGTLIQATVVLIGVGGGPVLGVFTLGILFPCANGKGAMTGMLVSLVITAWLGFGASFHRPYTYKYPTSVEGCLSTSLVNDTYFSIIENASAVNITTSQPDVTNNIDELIAESRTGIRALYSISYWYITLLATLVCNIVGLLVSFATGRQDPSTVDPRLISPVSKIMCCCLPSTVRRYLQCGVDHSNEVNVSTEDEQATSSKL